MATAARSDGAQRYATATFLLGFSAIVLFWGAPIASSHGGTPRGQSQPAGLPAEAAAPGDWPVSTHGEAPDAHFPGEHAALDLDSPAPLGDRDDATPAPAATAVPARPIFSDLTSKPRYANDRPISEEVLSWSRERELNPLLVWVVIDAESEGNPRAVSREGALGLMQVMPFHFRNGEDPFDIATNIKRGTAVLASYLAETGSIRLALAAYNAGPAAVRDYGGVPPYAETRRYINKTFDRYVKLLDLAIAGGVDPFSLRYASDP